MALWSGPRLATSQEAVGRILDLRKAVLAREPALFDPLKLDASMFRDAHDEHGFHWFIEAGGEVVAAARFCIHSQADELPHVAGFRDLVADLPAPIASFNRLVVHPSVRGRGLSRELTRARIAAAREKGAACIVMEAAPHRIEAMRDAGFQALGFTAGEPGDKVRFTLMKLDLRS